MKTQFTIMSENDIRIAVNATRQMGNALQFCKVDIQKLIVTVSELSQNVIDHTDSKGILTIESIDRKGIRITVQDHGTGIKQLDEILQGSLNFNKKGLGLGLLGAKRLMDEFYIETSEGGTKIIAIKWNEQYYQWGH